MNSQSIESKLQDFFNSEVAQVEPSSQWWDVAVSRATESVQVHSFWDRFFIMFSKPLLRLAIPAVMVFIVTATLWATGILPGTETGKNPVPANPGFTPFPAELLPAPGQTGVSTLPLFSWDIPKDAGGSPIATRFELVVSTSSTTHDGKLLTPDVLDFTGDIAITGPTYQTTTPLKSDTVYFWQTRAIANDPASSEWSDVFAFRTGP